MENAYRDKLFDPFRLEEPSSIENVTGLKKLEQQIKETQKTIFNGQNAKVNKQNPL